MPLVVFKGRWEIETNGLSILAARGTLLEPAEGKIVE